MTEQEKDIILDLLVELDMETSQEQKNTKEYLFITKVHKNRFLRLPKWGNEGFEAESIEQLKHFLDNLQAIKPIPKTYKLFERCVEIASR